VLSLWEQQAGVEAEPPARSLDGAVDADVCVVGGGYLGLWTALRLRELDPGVDVVLVEATRCGSGAAGRNGGFVLSWWSKFLTLEKLCGTEEALRLCRLSTEAIGEIGAFASASSIGCDYRRDGWIWSATSRAQLGAWDATVARLEALGEEPFSTLTPDDLAGRTGSTAHLAGVLEVAAATIQPAALVRGLRRVAIERGVRVFEGSPMRRLERSAPAKVVTDRGSVKASTVILTLSAWTGLVRELRRHLIVVASDVVATEAAPERLAEIGRRDGLCISDARQLVHYYRTTVDGRIVFGKGGGTLGYRGEVTPSFFASPARGETVERRFRVVYPTLADVVVTHRWSGPVDRTRSGLPVFSRLPGKGHVLFGFGFSGTGVGQSLVGGRILASLALDRRDGWSAAGLVREPRQPFPPEPVRYLGGRLVRAAVARKEQVEDAGDEPDRLTRALASLAPTSRGD
jgi:glycine/D-amino acid oxidase-like deaminating enzyme